MDEKEWLEIERRFSRLSFETKLRVLERLVRSLRQEAFDPAFERDVNAMAADPAVQRALSDEGGCP
jgi:hypothetical protein